MVQEVTTLLHGGTGEILLSEYLYRVGLHLLAIAVVAVVIHLGFDMVESAATPVAESEDEECAR